MLHKYLIIYEKRRGLVKGRKILMAMDEEEAVRTTRHSDPDFNRLLEVRVLS